MSSGIFSVTMNAQKPGPYSAQVSVHTSTPLSACPLLCKMAPKIRKDGNKEVEGKIFESVLIVCPKCKDVKEIVQAKKGKMQFVEYYCCPGKALEIHPVSIKPN